MDVFLTSLVDSPIKRVVIFLRLLLSSQTNLPSSQTPLRTIPFLCFKNAYCSHPGFFPIWQNVGQTIICNDLTYRKLKMELSKSICIAILHPRLLLPRADSIDMISVRTINQVFHILVLQEPSLAHPELMLRALFCLPYVLNHRHPHLHQINLLTFRASFANSGRAILLVRSGRSQLKKGIVTLFTTSFIISFIPLVPCTTPDPTHII